MLVNFLHAMHTWAKLVSARPAALPPLPAAASVTEQIQLAERYQQAGQHLREWQDRLAHASDAVLRSAMEPESGLLMFEGGWLCDEPSMEQEMPEDERRMRVCPRCRCLRSDLYVCVYAQAAWRSFSSSGRRTSPRSCLPCTACTLRRASSRKGVLFVLFWIAPCCSCAVC
jgi:hypothetical protein